MPQRPAAHGNSILPAGLGDAAPPWSGYADAWTAPFRTPGTHIPKPLEDRSAQRGAARFSLPLSGRRPMDTRSTPLTPTARRGPPSWRQHLGRLLTVLL